MWNIILAATVLIGGATIVLAQSPSPNGVKTLAPEGAIKTTGTHEVPVQLHADVKFQVTVEVSGT